MITRVENLDEKITELAARILADPQNPQLEAEIDHLASLHGDYVKEAITDRLTANGNGAYSQHMQDMETRSKYATEISGAQRLPMVLIGSLPSYFETPHLELAKLISSLVPADFYQIAREARLSRTESEVWDYFLQGYEPGDMVPFVAKHGGGHYTIRSMCSILERTREKVRNCPSLGWRTCLAEDIHRGKHQRLPLTVSWSEIMRRSDPG